MIKTIRISRRLFRILFLSAILAGGVLGFFSNFVSASTIDGTIDSAYKYAWSENAGWINFGVSGGNVHITDSGLSGYAWSGNYGWINLAPTTSGVKNNSNGVLSGYAWGENLGWINFSGVTINSNGEFSGAASGDISGRINFDCSNCKVKTDWRPKNTRGGGGIWYILHKPPTEDLGISINNGKEYTTSSTTTKIAAIALFTKSLEFGQVSSDIKRLQIFLNSDPDTQVAKSGRGSPGKETNVFGYLTRAAVIRFQEKYAKDVLAPWNLTKGTGFVRRTTRAKINELITKQ